MKQTGGDYVDVNSLLCDASIPFIIHALYFWFFALYTHPHIVQSPINTISIILNFHWRSFFSANSSPKIFAPSIRLDGLSLIEQHELKGAPWFQAGLPREISLEVLSRQTPGAFLVRQSSTKPGCFALSLRVPPPAPKVAHYLILKTPRGYKIKVSCGDECFMS